MTDDIPIIPPDDDYRLWAEAILSGQVPQEDVPALLAANPGFARWYELCAGRRHEEEDAMGLVDVDGELALMARAAKLETALRECLAFFDDAAVQNERSLKAGRQQWPAYNGRRKKIERYQNLIAAALKNSA